MDDLPSLLENFLKIVADGLNDDNKAKFNSISDKVEKIDINDISEFMTGNMESVVYYLLKTKSTKTVLFHSIIKRIGNYAKFDMENTIHSQLLKIYNNYTDTKNAAECKSEIIDYIASYAENNDIVYLNKLFNVAIKYKQYGTIDKLKYYVNLNGFIDETLYNPKYNILQMKGRKLFNMLIYNDLL